MAGEPYLVPPFLATKSFHEAYIEEGGGGGSPIDPALLALLIQKPITMSAVLPPLGNEPLIDIIMPWAWRLPANMAGSVGSFVAAPVAPMTFALQRNGLEVGTILVPISGAFTFATTSGAAQDFAIGSRLALVAPGSEDSAISRLSITLLGSLIT